VKHHAPTRPKLNGSLRRRDRAEPFVTEATNTSGQLLALQEGGPNLGHVECVLASTRPCVKARVCCRDHVRGAPALLDDEHKHVEVRRRLHNVEPVRRQPRLDARLQPLFETQLLSIEIDPVEADDGVGNPGVLPRSVLLLGGRTRSLPRPRWRTKSRQRGTPSSDRCRPREARACSRGVDLPGPCSPFSQGGVLNEASDVVRGDGSKFRGSIGLQVRLPASSSSWWTTRSLPRRTPSVVPPLMIRRAGAVSRRKAVAAYSGS